MRPVQKLLDLVARAAVTHGFGQHQMIVGAAGDEAYAVIGERSCKGRGVFHGPALVLPELLAHCLLEAHRLAGYDMHQRAALGPGEDRAVYLLFKLVPA